MGKTEINNEIVLLRHTVRQARVCIVNKLIREAKFLRDKNGNEAQREKNKRKADKLVAEVYALKTIKDDEISKFGIMNEKEVKDILQDQSSSSKDRIIARVTDYKSFHRRLMQFRERFPDYKMHLSEGKKKTTRLKKKNSVKSKKSLAENNHHPQREDTKELNVDSDNIIEDSQHDPKDKKTCASRLCETKNKSGKRKKSSNEDNTALIDKKLPKLVEDNISKDANKEPSEVKLCSVTREGTVKRFAELLKEQDSTEDVQTSAENLQTDHERAATVQARSVNDFFITENDEEGYQDANASTSRTKFDTSAKTLGTNNRVKTQNAKFKNEKRIEKDKAQKNSQSKKQPRGEKMTGRNKYSDEQSSAVRQEKRTSNRINKNINKNNLNVVNDGEKATDLHPSWLAKKKQQEVMSQGFQGKKIVFADD
ncbi:serum response factor-binding protein 1 [Odontomachus brunneus]|uniref:serum response factor-binding protein 1 n=1 Tax=Odontomachus brunneus TaxID=486640 RepID=UPI0013F23E07|nr:serum response factor-binding protein 1 [Odontomachus brunneus]